MLDRTIPFYNTILRCDKYTPVKPALPEGFTVVPYRDGYEKAWARLEYAVGDFDSAEEAEQYFAKTYLQKTEERENILFAVDSENRVVGSCIAWRDGRGDSVVSSLHWLVVAEAYQGMGLGKALCHAVMNRYAAQAALPVYIHTQPWSWKAILLYLSVGFRLQQSDTFSHYENQYDSAMSALNRVVTETQFARMRECSDC